jgi:hypothetical protein
MQAHLGPVCCAATPVRSGDVERANRAVDNPRSD